MEDDLLFLNFDGTDFRSRKHVVKAQTYIQKRRCQHRSLAKAKALSNAKPQAARLASSTTPVSLSLPSEDAQHHKQIQLSVPSGPPLVRSIPLQMTSIRGDNTDTIPSVPA